MPKYEVEVQAKLTRRIIVDEADEIDAITAAHDLFSFQQDEWNDKYEEETLSVKDLTVDRHALSNKLITNALKRGDIPRPQIDWQCDKGICEHPDRIGGRCQCYNEEESR